MLQLQYENNVVRQHNGVLYEVVHNVTVKRVCVQCVYYVVCEALFFWGGGGSTHVKLMHIAISRDNTFICLVFVWKNLKTGYKLWLHSFILCIHTQYLKLFSYKSFCKFTHLNCVTKWRFKYEFTCTKNQGNWPFINHWLYMCACVVISIYTNLYVSM